MNGIKFGEVIIALQEGAMAFRRSWYNDNMYIYIQIPTKIVNAEIKNMQSLPQVVKDLYEKTGLDISFKNQMGITKPNGEINSWVPSSSDINANDWFIVRKH